MQIFDLFNLLSDLTNNIQQQPKSDSKSSPWVYLVYSLFNHGAEEKS